uniref:Putative arylsulfatase b n=1 Tax=Nyssomyia neivai TaxID=330878 RepID=A0A1L8E4Y8_9DIPT
MFSLGVVLLFVLHLSVFLGIFHCKSVEDVKRPNIVIIMADDLGSHDLSLSGCNEIMTPNIDALGYQGIIFNRHYTQSVCGPSRSALLTGKYPIHTGQQHSVILPDEPRGLPLDEKILPQYLKEAGYKTHIVGKWHLGYARKTFTPTERGFDSHTGFLGGATSYFNYTYWFNILGYNYPPGFDFYRNHEVYNEIIGQYATDVLTEEATKLIRDHDPLKDPFFLYLAHGTPHASNSNAPLEAIPEDLETVAHINDPDRRTYAAMVKALDRSVGKVVTALKEKQMLENTIILFFSDNGAPTIGLYSNTGTNYPLRGQKQSPWEGALRGFAAIWSTLFLQSHYVSNHLIHITDWLPTFAHVAGISSYESKKLDGNNIWSTLLYNKPPSRNEILHNINPITGYTSYYYDKWKYINGTTADGLYDMWLGYRIFEDSPESSSYENVIMQSDVWKALNPFAKRILRTTDVNELRRKTEIKCHRQKDAFNTCNPLKAPCLFHLEADPCEMINLADVQPGRVIEMQKRIREFERTMVPPANIPSDPNANPDFNDGLWTWWLDNQDSKVQN